jgi:hypothetical protein
LRVVIGYLVCVVAGIYRKNHLSEIAWHFTGFSGVELIDWNFTGFLYGTGFHWLLEWNHLSEIAWHFTGFLEWNLLIGISLVSWTGIWISLVFSEMICGRVHCRV